MGRLYLLKKSKRNYYNAYEASQIISRKKKHGKIFFYLSPYTSKSFLAKAISTEIQGVFFSVSVANIFNKWMDESVKIIKR